MMIQNFKELAVDSKHQDVLHILNAGLVSAQPRYFLQKYVKHNIIQIDTASFHLDEYSSVYLVAFGKAADSMTKYVDSKIDSLGGIIVIPKNSVPVFDSKHYDILLSSHPVPDESSVDAAKSVIRFLKKRKRSELVLFLVSGGASSLLCLPDNIPLSDKIDATNLLLRSGATIEEFNCVRKHLSKIKGGKLTENLSCTAVSLITSDVRGNDPSVIASGMTCCDYTTFEDALKVINKYGLADNFPNSALTHIHDGVKGKIPETPKKPTIPNHVIASNDDCLFSMNNKAVSLGYCPEILHVYGDVKAAVRRIVQKIKSNSSKCIIFGGETTVRVKGGGKGGRNQELVLRILKSLEGYSGEVVFTSVGTDGIDGNTDAAGAIAKNHNIDTKEVNSILRHNDSNAFFRTHGGLIYTGYTHSNLMDIGVILT